ncbi:MAG: HEPN domain protein [Candidatus Gottesmanbacteria bacterium GW2011_GWC2_39_8]|uniref:HEPN domain protein n=1 Tax=Candidatus Gottesmanbacteria bacterium GW2011_GWC2_39_8 TaxID=1618450 RepID=A0A0G0SBE0_9BACT|nr:MAG: HEPN domain protein [Candidatus Gottesmanbacteria bacterium GW2011_GWC2_39_8]
MTQKEAYRFWIESGERNFQIAKDNFCLGHYDWALFFCHLTLEKLLKAAVIKKGEIPPPIHDLLKLGKISGILKDHRFEEELKEITTYNIEARYDDYKRSFYKKATKEYSGKWMDICEGIYLWLKKNI